MKNTTDSAHNELRFEVDSKQAVDNRKILLGGISLLSLSLMAVGIRTLFPDLNPFVLAGFGAAVYVIYIGLALRAEMSRLDEEGRKNELSKVDVPVSSSAEERL